MSAMPKISCRTSRHLATTQNDLLMATLLEFYSNKEHLRRMMGIINGDSKISLRIVDWFVTNFAKDRFIVYSLPSEDGGPDTRFKVYTSYKLKLKAYAKRRLDPFCRFDRISIPYDSDNYMETTIGQLNFFKWAIETRILEYIDAHYDDIERDMNTRNSTSRRRTLANTPPGPEGAAPGGGAKTRKKREELSVSACKCIKKENVRITMTFK